MRIVQIGGNLVNVQALASVRGLRDHDGQEVALLDFIGGHRIEVRGVDAVAAWAMIGGSAFPGAGGPDGVLGTWEVPDADD